MPLPFLSRACSRGDNRERKTLRQIMQKPNRAAYTAAEFLDWSSTKALVLSPKFQRRGVWQPAAKAFFIDSLLRGMPVPPVYLRMSQSKTKDRVVREVIDGQQRIAAVVAYMRDEYSLSGTLVSTWKGKKFSQLKEGERDAIRDYSFSAEVFSSLTDEEVLEIFSRLNTYAIKLNAQELRNGRYFGLFKQTAYKLGLEHLEFWREHGVFTERGIARMEEAELVSELLIAGIAGLQDKKKSIDGFYAQLDEQFPDKDLHTERFRNVLAEISDISNGSLKDTEFNRRPLFYSLFTALYHRMYGLPGGDDLPQRKKAPLLSSKEKERLGSTIVLLSDALAQFGSDGEDADEFDEELKPFVEASLRQTDNIRPRLVRLTTIYTRAFG